MFVLFMRARLNLHRLHVAIIILLNCQFLRNNGHIYNGKLLQVYRLNKCSLTPIIAKDIYLSLSRFA